MWVICCDDDHAIMSLTMTVGMGNLTMMVVVGLNRLEKGREEQGILISCQLGRNQDKILENGRKGKVILRMGA